MERKENYARSTVEYDTDNKASQKEVPAFRMGPAEKYTPSDRKGKRSPSVKTRLIVQAGGYGKDPFTTSNEQAKGLLGRNQECFCGSKKKYKKCCLR